ncbi:Myb-like DNA-binding domain protein [Lunasporangiospora selenospora]|uniref:Myb-like DNA-binding domain protein n=1 Tax=Lunasporangiospora selenospora TaxID=979761 RepID=A0A9P6G0G4_9FUNG|nr:Myb-like DNA-binding domain protein [Lunasporangiospora selenospora]
MHRCVPRSGTNLSKRRLHFDSLSQQQQQCFAFRSLSTTDLISRSLFTFAEQQQQQQLFRPQRRIVQGIHDLYIGNSFSPRLKDRLARPFNFSKAAGFNENWLGIHGRAYSTSINIDSSQPSALEEPSISDTTTPSTTEISLPTTRKLQKQVPQPWILKEDQYLLGARQRGVSWKMVAKELNRNKISCYTRYYRFLDPLLEDAVEDYMDNTQADTAIESSKIAIASDSIPTSSSKKKTGFASDPRDRTQLEILATAKIPWPKIALELERKTESCKEKWYRIRTSRNSHQRFVYKIQSRLRIRLLEEGFIPLNQKILIRAVERQLRARRSSADPMSFLSAADGDEYNEDNDNTFLHEPDTNEGQYHSPASEIDRALGGLQPGIESIDWSVIAARMKNRFSPERLKEIYWELAEARMIWTPEEDEKLTRAVIRFGPPELQPIIWTIIKRLFGESIRTENDYKERWRLLDKPLLEREWDESEKTKFWRRWAEYHREDSLLEHPAFSKESLESAGSPDMEKGIVIFKLGAQFRSKDPVIAKLYRRHDKAIMWDLIAEGLEYRHGVDCQQFFETTTRLFPADPEEFQQLLDEVMSDYLRGERSEWSTKSTQKLVVAVNSFIRSRKAVDWESVAKDVGGRYTAAQCNGRWYYWKQTHNVVDQPPESEEDTILTSEMVANEPLISPETSSKQDRRLWTDKELEVFYKGVEEHGTKWTEIQNAYLPHRTIQMLHERYWRDQRSNKGPFTEQELSLLASAILTHGEQAGWSLLASHVPGRSAQQCRMTWMYGRTHHVEKMDEPWNELDRIRLLAAVERFGEKQWVAVSDFVVGKTPDQCRFEWNNKANPNLKRGEWSSVETGQLIERVVDLMSRQEIEEERRIQENLLQDDSKSDKGSSQAPFVDLAPRYRGKRKVDWYEISKSMDGRTPDQCRIHFEEQRKLYYIEGNF